jgi:hypothetical protein
MRTGLHGENALADSQELAPSKDHARPWSGGSDVRTCVCVLPFPGMRMNDVQVWMVIEASRRRVYSTRATRFR